jgi:hypothetical protein
MRFRVAVVHLTLAACCLFAGIAYGNRPAPVPSVTAAQSPRVCFDVGEWGPAPQRFAPCVRIRRVAEDGSFTFAVSDRDGTVRYVSGVGALDR